MLPNLHVYMYLIQCPFSSSYCVIVISGILGGGHGEEGEEESNYNNIDNNVMGMDQFSPPDTLQDNMDQGIYYTIHYVTHNSYWLLSMDKYCLYNVFNNYTKIDLAHPTNF